MSYKWPGIPNGDYSFDHGRAVWNKIINFLRRLCEKLDGDLVDATADRRGMMTAADKDKLDGVEPGAEVNQNAFSGVKVGNSTIEADDKTDVLELVAGTNISLTVDTTSDKVTITNTYEHPTYTPRTGKPTQDQTPGFGGTVTVSQVESDGTGHVTGMTDRTITIPATEASQSVAGLMSTTDKTKLDGIAANAEVNQNAFSNVKVGSTTVAADGKTDTLELAAGTGITLTPDATNDKVTIAVTNNTYADYSHTHEYLPLSGGTITGNISMNHAHFVNKIDTAELQIHGGTGWSKGATLVLHGYDKNVNSGVFVLYANDGAGNTTILRGEPNGNLNWSIGGTYYPVEIVKASSVGSSGYILFKSGVQWCWGDGTCANPPAVKNFARAFSSAPKVLMCGTGYSSTTTVQLYKVTSTSTTGFTPVANSNGSFGTGTYNYLAVGKGA